MTATWWGGEFSGVLLRIDATIGLEIHDFRFFFLHQLVHLRDGAVRELLDLIVDTMIFVLGLVLLYLPFASSLRRLIRPNPSSPAPSKLSVPGSGTAVGGLDEEE